MLRVTTEGLEIAKLFRAAQRMNGKRRSIRTTMLDESFKTVEVDVQATVYGPFAVHRTPGNGKWSITHVRSGALLGCRFRSQDQARVFIQMIKDLDWDFDTYKDASKATRIGFRRAQRAFRNAIERWAGK